MIDRRREVVRELLAFGAEQGSAAQVGDAFTDNGQADELVKRSPEAFLLGVLFTQGIPAERAWAGPWLLRQRLGHLDLRRLAAEPDAVAEAVARPPMLHRFKRTLPAWISQAADRLLEEYGGDASRIWAEDSDAAEVMARLEAFAGIGRKKAAMAVGILSRHFGVRFTGLDRGEVAYDVHVRRVFLRSGLVEEDTPHAVREAARRGDPRDPASLDLPAWLVGRDWCRPSDPHCDECRLGSVCPRRTSLEVEGVGSRRAR